MSVPLTKRSTNHSDLESFSFVFFCDSCGKEWKSPPLPFESGGFTAIEHEAVRQMIWAQEHKAAFEKANLEAHFHFNHFVPEADTAGAESGEWVCDECFEKKTQTV